MVSTDNRFQWVLIVLVCWLSSGLALAQVSDAPTSYFRIAPEYQVLIDTSGHLSLGNALASSDRWVVVPGTSVNQGFIEQPLWLRLDVEVQTGQTLDTLLELGLPFLDVVDFYLVQWDTSVPRIINQQTAGDHRDFSQRFQQHRYPLFAVNFPQSGRYSLFLRIKSASPLMFQMKLHYEDSFYQYEIRGQVFYGVFFGVILVLAYFNLMLLIYLRERTFLHNLFFVISIGIYQAALSGFGYNYIWQGNVLINDHVLAFSASASFFFGGMFAIQFMELKTRTPLFYRIANILMAGFMIPMLLSVIATEYIVVLVLQVLSLLTAAFAFAVMIHQVHARNPWAMYLLLGWSVTIGGYIVFVMSMLGVLEFGSDVMAVQAIGLGLGNILVTTAIAARVRRERREKTFALHHALELSQEVARLTREKEHLENTANLHLQKEVEEKTQELNQMLEMLQNSNRRLERDSMSDPLTGLHNRRYLDSVFADTIQQCIKHRSSLGVLVIDADHFKKINDSFGHLAGDEVLRKLGTILQKYCRRNMDILVRFGGEEFVMLLPATDLEGVLKIAESIRHHVQYAQFWFEDRRVPVTLSMGVHVGIPPLHATPEKLMHKADEALYLAKSNGRNRVEVYKSRFEVVKA